MDKDKKAEANRQWAAENPDKVKESQAKYVRDNAEKVRESKRKYREANNEKLKAAHKAYYKEHKNEYSAYYVGNKPAPEVAKARDEKWRRDNPEAAVAKTARHRALGRKAPGHFTGRDFIAIKESYLGRCVYCGSEAKLTADHIVPLNKGGENYPENIVPACGKCNSAKGDRSLLLFLYSRSRV